MQRTFIRHFAVLLLLLLSAQLSWAQGVTTSAMNGAVTDKTGQGLPGATVIAVHTPTGTQYVAPTNSDGRFNIQNMRVGGPYNVRVTFIGYQEVSRDDIYLTLGQNLRLDLNLSEASTELAGVVVTGQQDPVINSGRTGAATSIQREQIMRLPTLSRSFQDFTRLTPQANSGGTSFAGRNGNYNNVTIDGALFNNAFGLSSTVGGQTNSQPISLDAIEEIQVNIAPYDVRQGSFTGAGINAVTRSGTNKFTGSVYAFRRNNSLVAGRVRDIKQSFPDFSLWQYGARVGGPLIQNKLFFFVSAEAERRDDPPGTFVPTRAGTQPGPNVSTAHADELSTLSDFLQTQYEYNTGPFENYQLKTFSNKLTAKIDWNINANNTFNIKYNYLKSYRDVPPSPSGAPRNGRNPSNTNLPFLAAYYRINNNLNSVIAELNTKFAGNISNSFQAGYTALRDFRESSGGVFPLVDIENGQGLAFTSFGYEPFSANNLLNTNTFQISDNLTFSLGKHLLTAGTYNEIYKVENGFSPNFYGRYRFTNLTNFYAAAGYDYNPATLALAPSMTAPAKNPVADYEQSYSAVAGTAFPLAVIKPYQLGFYLQDEWTLLPNLRVTPGMRIDIPVVKADIARNADAATRTFRDGETILTDRVQKTRVLYSPRVGFNWDVKNDRNTQVRGGTGIFTGRVPFVWITNQAGNNGVLFNSFRGLTTPSGQVVNQFSPDVTTYLPSNGQTSSSYNLAYTDRNFKYPQVWRSNLGVDHRLPGDVIVTLEGIYTKDINAVYTQNVNLPNTLAFAGGGYPDQRPLYRNPTNLNQAVTAIPANSNISNAILLTNTNRGYSYTLTAQVQKTFDNGISGSLAYNYADSRSVNDGGSIANSIWRDREISGDPNSNVLSYSNFLQQHRIVGSASYNIKYLDHASTTLSLFLNAGPGFRYSYIYNGDMNGDNNRANDLIYIPRDRSEIVLNDIPFTYKSGANTVEYARYTADQQYADLDTYIKQDKYLSKRRGEYAERNGGVAPWTAVLDARLLQNLFTNIGKTKNTLQFSVDVFNLTNLINKNWGVYQFPVRTGLLTYQNFNAQSKPTFIFPYQTDPTPNTTTGTELAPGRALTNTNQYNTNDVSRWQIQLGLRYLFD